MSYPNQGGELGKGTAAQEFCWTCHQPIWVGTYHNCFLRQPPTSQPNVQIGPDSTLVLAEAIKALAKSIDQLAQYQWSRWGAQEQAKAAQRAYGDGT